MALCSAQNHFHNAEGVGSYRHPVTRYNHPPPEKAARLVRCQPQTVGGGRDTGPYGIAAPCSACGL